MFHKPFSMKHFFTFLFAILFCTSNAQTYPWLNQFYNELPSRGDLFDSSMAANHFHSRTNTLTQFDKKGTKKKGSDTFYFQYDDKGFMTSLFESNSKNKKTEKYEYAITDSVLMGYKYYKKNKLERDYSITRNSKKKITDLVKKNGKGEIVLKQHNEFDESINMLTRVVTYGKNNKEENLYFRCFASKALCCGGFHLTGSLPREGESFLVYFCWMVDVECYRSSGLRGVVLVLFVNLR